MTPGAHRVLKLLADDEKCDLVTEGRLAYCMERQTTVRVVYELLRCMAISVSWSDRGSAIYYQINGAGRAILRRPELESEIKAALGKGPFSIIEDKIVYLNGVQP